jgi:AcrR family transcriptional regulator
MGNREALLDGAERCLVDKGYARTTARDITAEAGVSLAAIGYHFGSKEELLKAALRRSLERWGDEISGLKQDMPRSVAEVADRFVGTWDRVIDSFRESSKLWAVQFELLAALEREPELRQSFAAETRHARIALANLFDTIPEDNEEAEKLGAFYQVLLAGLAAQWLSDPETTPSGDDLLVSIRLVAIDMLPNGRA